MTNTKQNPEIPPAPHSPEIAPAQPVIIPPQPEIKPEHDPKPSTEPAQLPPSR